MKRKPNEKTQVDKRMVTIARELIENAPRETTVEYLVDAFQDSCRKYQIQSNRKAAIAAIETAIGQRGLTA